MHYIQRYDDKLLRNKLKSSGAVLITGPKGCGKTETAKQIAKSSVDLLVDRDLIKRMEFSPNIILEGEKPHLIDEWQEFPEVWNYVKKDIDIKKTKGNYILTGSSNPTDNVKIHSGVGRFSILEMSTMSWSEKGWSTNEISIPDLFNKKIGKSTTKELSLEEIIERLILGGWPGLLNENVKTAYNFLRDYINLTAQVDIPRAVKIKRDPVKVKKFMASYARNIATKAEDTTLAKDTMISIQSVIEYSDVLKRLMLINELPAYNTHIRSTYSLRKAPVRHFVDPSLCIGALNLTEEKLLSDLQYTGFLFESAVVNNLRTYVKSLDGNIFHYRDSSGLEVDIIIELPSSEWVAVEVKLGMSNADEAATNLLKLHERAVKKPNALVVITGNGFIHQRKDGVIVVPLNCLGA